MKKDGFDKSFDELIEKGYIEQVGARPDGEPEYRLTDKGLENQDQLDFLKRVQRN
jgi:hypothetical protein